MTTIPTTIQERIPLPLPGASAAPASKSITPGDVLGMIRQRLVTIIILSLLFCSTGVGLFFLAWVKFPLYSANAYIECISNAPSPQLTVQKESPNKDVYDRFIKSQALFLKQYNILSAALRDAAVRDTDWFRSIPEENRIRELEKAISCAPVRDTSYLNVAMSTRKPSDPHKIVNKVVEVYIHQVRERASEQYRQELTDYRQELADIKSQIQEKKRQIQEFGATILPGERPTPRGAGYGVLADKIKQQQEQITILEQEVTQMESMYRIYNDPSGPAITEEDKQLVEQDPRVSGLDNQVRALEQEISIQLANFGPNHREVKAMQTRLDEAEVQLFQAREKKLRDIYSYKKEQLATAYYSRQDSLLRAKENLAESQAKQADLDRQLAEYDTLQNELTLLIEIQNKIDSYIRDINRIVQERAAIRVSLAMQAQAPKERSFPSLLMLPLIVIGAFALAVGSAIGLELIDTSVRSPQDIVRHVNLPVLGSIPDVDDEEVDIERVETAVRDAPHAMITEAFRTVRSNLQFSAPADRMRTILVTSPKPEDGKTTIAANIAASLANAGRRVLLVDANLRRPSLHRLFTQVNSKGMTNILIGEAKLADCVHSTELANLDVVGCGPVPPNPAELLGGDLFGEFVTEALRSYDHVIFDSPPLLLASDATVLATRLDGVILTCRAKGNSRGVVQRARSLLEHVNAHIFGVVLNAARVRRGGYFREQLRTFYEYQSEEEQAESARRALPNGDKSESANGKKPEDEIDESKA